MKVKKVIFYIAVLLSVTGLIAFLITYREKILRILSPFLLSVPLVYIVKPVSEKLLRKRIPVGVSVALVYLAFIILVAAAGIFFIPELAANMRELMETLPELLAQYEQIFNRLLSYIKTSNWSEQVKAVILREIQNTTGMVHKFLADILENGLEMLLDVARMVVDITIAMVITYYVAKDGQKFREWFLMLFPRSARAGLISTGKEISRILAGFIQGQLITAVIVGILETAAFLFMGIKYPLVLGMIGGIANIIPYFGPYIGAVPAVAIALTISPLKALWVVVALVIIQQIENSFISPKMIEGKVGLHPVATIFAVLAGGEFFGILGMLLAVPVVAIIRVLVNKIVEAVA